MLKLYAFLLTLVVFGSIGVPAVVHSAPEMTVKVESLGLQFEPPQKWRLSRESTPEQLVLYPGKTKTIPLLRVRTFQGDFSTEDRLAAMTRGLPEEEANVHFISSKKWAHERRRYETATVEFKKGSREWYGLFTLVTQPRRLQHGFWLFGKKKDVDRQWEVVKASIITARSIRLVGSEDESTEDSEPEQAVAKEAAWSDPKSGLSIASWPAGFTPDDSSLKRFHKSGIELLPVDTKAHKSTAFLLTCKLKAKDGAAMDAAASLHTELGEKSTVRDLRRIPVRVGGEEAALIKWVDEAGSSPIAYQVHFVQKDDRSFYIEYSAAEAWSRARSRRSLLKDFIAGISLD